MALSRTWQERGNAGQGKTLCQQRKADLPVPEAEKRGSRFQVLFRNALKYSIFVCEFCRAAIISCRQGKSSLQTDWGL